MPDEIYSIHLDISSAELALLKFLVLLFETLYFGVNDNA